MSKWRSTIELVQTDYLTECSLYDVEAGSGGFTGSTVALAPPLLKVGRVEDETTPTLTEELYLDAHFAGWGMHSVGRGNLLTGQPDVPVSRARRVVLWWMEPPHAILGHTLLSIPLVLCFGAFVGPLWFVLREVDQRLKAWGHGHPLATWRQHALETLGPALVGLLWWLHGWPTL